jgi:uncharacterized membrane protein
MEKRPHLQLPLTPVDKKIEIIGMLFLVILWGLSVYAYFTLPDTIPTHFNFAGKVDATGKKETILILPGIATLIYFGISYLCKFPHVFNYPVPINSNNAEKQYRIAIRMLRLLKISVLAVFCLVIVLIYINVNGKINTAVIWFIPLVVLLMFIPTIWGIRQAFRHK